MPSPPEFPLAKPVDRIPSGSLSSLRRQAADCQACPLWRDATQTVFGVGPAKARAVLIGEQPGNREDIEGKPFVGPAGALLREALLAAGIDPAQVYLTNTVKHFKFERSKKVRMHKRANAAEQAACRPWLAAELLRLKPQWVVALGAMAAQTVFGNGFRLTQSRGTWHPRGSAQAMATWHPAAILRMPGEGRQLAREQFFADLQQLGERLRHE
jgi:uracil-DNA glycosylase